MSNEFDTKLQTQLSQLQKDKSPERDLWAGIEVAITARKHRSTPWTTPLTAVAASIAVCLLGILLVNQMRSSSSTESNVVAQLDALHQQEMSALKVAFQKTPSLTNNWSEQLRDMDKAAEAIKAALKHDPQNLTLLKMLNDVYQRQIDLLKTVHEPDSTHLQSSDLI
jgi:negative regulator of sigma E activity